MTHTLNNSDYQLKSLSTDALEWVPAVNSNHVAVSVTEGAVIPSGEVPSYPERSAAVSAVPSVHGVTSARR